MPVAAVFLAAVLVFAIAFFTYGRYLARLFGLDPTRPVPAALKEDGIDFVPTRPAYLLGQHFSAISAAGPIVGPIVAGIPFGWLPALLWVVVGAVFIGAMHDFSALIGSVRHGASSVAEIVREHMSQRAFILFHAFVWLALVYVIIAFTDITARAFVDTLTLPDGRQVAGGGVAAASVLYLGIGLLMGMAMRVFRLPLWLATVIFLPLVGLAIAYGQRMPIAVPGTRRRGHSHLGLPDPRLLRHRLDAADVGAAPAARLSRRLLPLRGPRRVVRRHPPRRQRGRRTRRSSASRATGWAPSSPPSSSPSPAAPARGSTASSARGRPASSSPARPTRTSVGYGGMLLEGVVAVISLACVMMLARGSAEAASGPNAIYALGIGSFLRVFGVDPTWAVAFALLAFTTFVYDTLDVATRLGRYVLQELLGLRWPRAAPGSPRWRRCSLPGALRVGDAARRARSGRCRRGRCSGRSSARRISSSPRSRSSASRSGSGAPAAAPPPGSWVCRWRS